MKHFKDTINKITKGMEFGIVLENIKDLQVGDIIQCYRQEQQKATGVSNEQA
jgi:translation initiation factor IF-2